MTHLIPLNVFLLNKLGLPKGISSVIEGESLFNDGIGVALFVFMQNVITNAKEAMSDNGKIQIDMQLISDIVVTTVTDFGVGMKPEVLEQCFDPLFSTKIAETIGMGLPVAQQIVEKHNGTIKITSEPIKGTSVVISLPINKN